MIGEYRFFQDFFDGQIVKPETEKYKLFKVMLFSCFSALGLFLVFSGFCNWAGFVLLELGMLWNIYSDIDKKISLILCVGVSVIYFIFAVEMQAYANAIIYMGCYIPFQLIALSKDYSEGCFIQIRKKITDYNKILFVMFFVALSVILSLFSYAFDGEHPILDGCSASLLVCSALLRNERYFEYYIFRVFALVLVIYLWILNTDKFGAIGNVGIIVMYASYLIYDVVTLFYQQKTYVNQYMEQVANYNKMMDDKLVQEKLEVYKKAEEKDAQAN